MKLATKRMNLRRSPVSANLLKLSLFLALAMDRRASFHSKILAGWSDICSNEGGEQVRRSRGREKEARSSTYSDLVQAEEEEKSGSQ